MTAEQPSLYLHIGLPKTASTYLQEKVFPALSDIHYVGTPAGAPFAGKRDREHGQRTLTGCFQRSAAVWDAYGTEILSAILGPELNAHGNQSILISDEGAGREATRPELFRAHLDGLKRCAIRAGYRNLCILCFIRRQDHWLASHYAQLSDRNPTASQHDFELTVQEILDPARGRFAFGMLLDFATLYRQLSAVLTTDDILMLPYEQLAENPAHFLSSIGSFLPNNAGLSERLQLSEAIGRGVNVRTRGTDVWRLRQAKGQLNLRTRLSRVFRHVAKPGAKQSTLRQKDDPQVVLTKNLSEIILGEFRASNKELADFLDSDLSRYGYY